MRISAMRSMLANGSLTTKILTQRINRHSGPEPGARREVATSGRILLDIHGPSTDTINMSATSGVVAAQMHLDAVSVLSITYFQPGFAVSFRSLMGALVFQMSAM